MKKANDIKGLIKFAISLAKGETPLARKLGCSQPMVNRMKNTGRVSAKIAVAFELAFPKHFRREQFRPDLFGVRK